MNTEGRSDLDRDAYIELASTTDQLQREFTELLRAFDLTLAQFNVLRALGLSDDAVSIGYLSDAMLTKTPDMTRLLDRLEERDLIVRRPAAHDRRSVVVALTKAGRDLHARAGRSVDECHRRQWSALSAHDLDQLVTLLRRVRATSVTSSAEKDKP